MSFATYNDLKAGIASWLMRQDLETQIPQFIELAETELDSVLRVRKMLKRSTALAEGQYIALPTDWRKARNVQRTSDGQPLGYMALDEIDQYRAGLNAGQISNSDGPCFYTLLGESMELAPAPSTGSPAEIEMVYYAKVPRLTSGSPTNWLLQDHPSIYLYGALIHSAPFLKDDERLAVWERLYGNAVASANEADANARYSGAPMVRRPKGF